MRRVVAWITECVLVECWRVVDEVNGQDCVTTAKRWFGRILRIIIIIVAVLSIPFSISSS